MRKCQIAVLCGVCVLGAVASTQASPTILQDYESAGLAAPWNLQPGFSGTSEGIDAGNSTTQITDDGADGTAQCAELFIPYVQETVDSGASWQMRFLPNAAGHGPTAFDPTGYVGYYLKVDPAVAADMVTAPVLEEASGGTGTATAGVLKTIIKDGQWHLYEWNMGNAADFPNTFNLTGTGVYGSGGGLGDTTLNGQQVFDSIVVRSSSPDNATIRIDQIGYGYAAVPEPGSLGLLALGGLAFLRRRRSC